LSAEPEPSPFAEAPATPAFLGENLLGKVNRARPKAATTDKNQAEARKKERRDFMAPGFGALGDETPQAEKS
jgi:hypothetical protein